MAEVMCEACGLGLCAYCTLKDCTCDLNPTDDITKRIHDVRRTLDDKDNVYREMAEGADLEQ